MKEISPPTCSKSRIILVGNNKGGVAKTTSTSMNAQYLARRGLAVLVLDLDPQCNLSTRMLRSMEREAGTDGGVIPPLHPDFHNAELRAQDPDWDGRASTADIFTGGTYIYQSDFQGVDIIPGHSQDLEEIVVKIAASESEHRIIDVLATFLSDPFIQSSYDVVFIDTPPSRNAIVMSGLRAATDVLIVTDLTKDSLLGLQTLRSNITTENWRPERELSPLNLAGIAISKFDTRAADMLNYREILLNDPNLGPLVIDPPLTRHKAIRFADDIDSDLHSVFDLKKSDPPYRSAISFCEAIAQRILGTDYGRLNKIDETTPAVTTELEEMA